jgi:hypothetical protein
MFKILPSYKELDIIIIIIIIIGATALQEPTPSSVAYPRLPGSRQHSSDFSAQVTQLWSSQQKSFSGDGLPTHRPTLSNPGGPTIFCQG